MVSVLYIYFFFVTRGGGGKSSVSHSAEFKDGKPLEGFCCCRAGIAVAVGTIGEAGASPSASPKAIDCIDCDNERNSCVRELLHILQDSLNCEIIAARSL
jgi:hypothetical protein